MLFRLDAWQELFAILARNGFRTVLTAFSVAWGIFILVILQASGNAIANGVAWNFRDDAVNSIWIYGGETSLPHQGLAPGREIQLHTADMQLLLDRLPEAYHMTARFYPPGGDPLVRYRDQVSSIDLRATTPTHRHLEMTETLEGRFLHPTDLEAKRKVAVLGRPVVDLLFEPGQQVLGQYVEIDNVAYKVVGIFKDEGGEREEQMIYIPLTTAQQRYGGFDKLSQIMFEVGTQSPEVSGRIADRARHLLAAKYHFAEDDPRAVFVRNLVERFDRVMRIVRGLQFFVLFVSIGTLIAGVVGVSNVMLISVRERTRELGIRKALGATPASLLGLIMHEALFLTLTAGYLGLLAGVGMVELAQTYMPAADYFRNPEVDFGLLGLATGLLAVAGLLAGLFPAWQAARIHPIEALQKG
jgi:putative ABC transport system permease protein